MIRNLLAGAMALALSPPQQAQTPPPTFVHSDYIEKISCLAMIDGEIVPVSGTGFKLKDGRWVSANHVTENMACQIDGRPIQIVAADPVGDVSVFTVPGDDREGGYEVDCGGFIDKHWYAAQGHAEGLPVIRSLNLMYSKIMDFDNERGMTTLIYNAVIPGMSGGPVIDSLSGKVEGTVNMYHRFFPISWSHALKGTPVCQ